MKIYILIETPLQGLYATVGNESQLDLDFTVQRICAIFETTKKLSICLLGMNLFDHFLTPANISPRFYHI